MIVNACWVVGCLPIFTIGASTTAMYATVQKNLIHDQGYPFQIFWKEFKRNFKNATIIWLLVLLVSAVMVFDISYLFEEAGNGHGWGLMYLLIAVVLVFLILTTLYTFGYIAKFDTGRWYAFRSSFIIMLMHPFRNLLFLALGALMILVISWQIWLILLLPVTYMISFTQFLEKSFYKLMTDEQKAEEDERNRNYGAEERREQKERERNGLD